MSERTALSIPSNAMILAIDTSSAQASFALQHGAKLLSSLVTDNGLQHSQTFFGHLDALLKLAGVELSDVHIIAAITGPGSFTGLRVGLAATQGLAQTLQVPAIGLTTLDVVALGAGVTGRVLVVQGAGRDEVFIGVREVNQFGGLVTPKPDIVGHFEALWPAFVEIDWLTNPLLIVGSGLEFHRAWLTKWADENGLPLSFDVRLNSSCPSWQALTISVPQALTLARFVADQLNQPDFAELYPLRACYIRPSDAELKAAHSL